VFALRLHTRHDASRRPSSRADPLSVSEHFTGLRGSLRVRPTLSQPLHSRVPVAPCAARTVAAASASAAGAAAAGDAESHNLLQAAGHACRDAFRSLDGMWGTFAPMAGLFFMLAFVNTILDSLKDTLVITAVGGGAHVIPWLTGEEGGVEELLVAGRETDACSAWHAARAHSVQRPALCTCVPCGRTAPHS